MGPAPLPEVKPPIANTPPMGDNPALGAPVGMRRLTRREYANSIAALVGEPLNASDLSLAPENTDSLFGNDFKQQTPSGTLIDGAENLAERAVTRLLAADRRAALTAAFLPCKPTGPADMACLQTFVERFGRRALRRPLAADEVAFFVGRGLERAKVDNDFFRGVELGARVLLQDPEFLYRVEIGDAAGTGVVKLTSHEVASRLAFLLWEGPPEDAPGVNLAGLADAGKLRTRQEVEAVARAMLGVQRAQAQILRFHGLWMGYEEMAATNPARRESAALIERSLGTTAARATRPWLDIFRSTETFVNAALAKTYGLVFPAGTMGFAWVPYGTSPRKGIVSHQVILSKGSEDEATTQIHRGKHLLETFFCKPVPPLTDELRKQVAMANLPTATGNACKIDVAQARLDTSTLCSACHRLIESAGFGLENYDGTGALRTTEPMKPACSIGGEGEILGVGRFKGLTGGDGLPGLADLMVTSGAIERCGVSQYFRFAMGGEEADGAAPIDALTQIFRGSNHDFQQLVVAQVGSEVFRYRKEEK
jgi:hypothetical protein